MSKNQETFDSISFLLKRGSDFLGCKFPIMGGAMTWVSENKLVSAIFPLTTNEELPTFAFPYSPVHSDRGCVYEFSLNHLLELNNPMDAFHLKVSEV